MARVFRRNRRRITSFCMAFTIALVSVLGFLGTSTPVKAADKTAAQIQQEKQALDKKIQQAQANIAATKKKLQAEKNKQADLQVQITNVEGQLTLYLSKIDTVNAAIKQKQLEIDKKASEVELNEDLFAERVHNLYISNTSASTMATLLSAESFSDFLNRAEILKRISESDQQLINTLSQEKEDLKNMKADLESEKAELTQTKNEISNKEKELESLYSQSKGNETALQKAEEQYLKDKQKYEKQNQALEAELQRILAAQASGDAYGDGILKWPMPGYSRISSPFGWRYIFGQRDWHTGIDIPAPKGTGIVAADAGKVLWVKKVSYGYGWHLLIDHGDGKATLYAHTSRIDVSEGQMVTKGQVIAGIGTTGTSTGYHLHFEVRINGAQVNPLGYVKAPA